MLRTIARYLFFSNYFIGLLAVALAVETRFQLQLPFNAVSFYVLLFSITVLFYTRAYISPSTHPASNNERANWYFTNHVFITRSQIFFTGISLIALWVEISGHGLHLPSMPFRYWLVMISVPLAALLYYGLWPYRWLRKNLRNIGWIKPFVIGYVWAGTVTAFPVIAAAYEQQVVVQEPGFMLWLFVKNWMFCAVNAVMFDIKDYTEDANRELKTFVVQFGLHRTIWMILFPLLLLGFGSFLAFSFYNQFKPAVVFINTIPFLCLLAVAVRLNYKKNILYYLIVIDGLLLVKAFCGIIAAITQ